MNVSCATSAISTNDDEIIPSERGRKFLDSLQKCVNGTKLNDASIRLAFGVGRLGAKTKSVKNSTSKIKFQPSSVLNKNIFFDEIKDEFDHDVRELLREGNVMASLNKLDKIQNEQYNFGEKYRKIPKWRPYGFPEDDLRPYRMKYLSKFRSDLNESVEILENEKKLLIQEIVRRRSKIKENEKIYQEKIEEILNFDTNFIDESIADEILQK